MRQEALEVSGILVFGMPSATMENRAICHSGVPRIAMLVPSCWGSSALRVCPPPFPTRLVNDVGLLRSLGIGVLPPGMSLQAILDDDFLIIRDSEQAATAGMFALSLICRRSMTLAWHSRGLPGLFVALLCPEHGQATLDKIRQYYEYWLKISVLTGSFWKRVQERSPFRLVFVEQIVQLAKRRNWRMTGTLVEVVRDAFSCIGATKVVEDAWQRERHVECHKGTNRRMRRSRMWMTPVDKKVLGSLHRYSEVPFSQETLTMNSKYLNMDALFVPRLRNTSMNFRPIVSQKQGAQWYSPSPLNYFGHVADLSMYRHVCEYDCADKAAQSWLTILACGQNMCIRDRARGGKFYSVFASYSGVAAVGWPAVRVDGRGGPIYKIADEGDEADVAYLHILDLAEWEAFAFSWAGPLQVSKQFGVEGLAVAAIPDHPPESLFQICARKAFFKLPKTPLVQVAKVVNVALGPDDSLLKILEKLIRKVHPKMKDVEILEVLRLRAVQPCGLNDLLDELDVAELGNPDEEKQIKSVAKDMKDAELHLSDFAAQFKVYEASVKGAKVKRVGGGKSLKVGRSGRPYPLELPELADARWQGAEFINSLLPPDDSKIYRDVVGQRFQTFWTRSRRTRSCVWPRYGYMGSALRAELCMG